MAVNKRFGLGKGLDSIIQDKGVAAPAEAPVKDRPCFMMSAVAQVKVRCMSTNGTVCKSEGSH